MKFEKKIFFGSNLKYLRQQRGYQQAEIAEMINLGRSTVSNYENGQSTPEFSVFLQLIEIFGISADELLFSDLSASKEALSKSGKHAKPVEAYATKAELDILRNQFSETTQLLNRYISLMGDYKDDLYKMQSKLEGKPAKKKKPGRVKR